MNSYDDAPEVRVICHLSEDGLRDAVRQGVQTSRTVTHYLQPDHECWEEFFALDPQLFYRTNGETLDTRRHPAVAAEIVVGRQIDYSVEPKNPERHHDYNSFLSDECIETWKRPSLVPIFGNPDDAVELDQYLSVADLLRYTRKLADSSGRSQAQDKLRSATVAWRLWAKSKGVANIAAWLEARAAVLENGQLSYSAETELRNATAEFFRLVKDTNVGRADDALLAKIIEAVPAAYDAVWAAQETLRKVEEQKEELSDAARWVEENGSARLRKALAADLLDSSMGAYSDERLAMERPSGGWRWRPQKFETKQIVNPSEDALDALLIAREENPHAWLSYEKESRRPIISTSFLRRPIYAYADDVLEAWRADEANSRDGELF